MKFKRIFIAGLLLLTVITVGAVSASDNLTAGDFSDDSALESSAEEIDLSAGDEDITVDVPGEAKAFDKSKITAALPDDDEEEGEGNVDIIPIVNCPTDMWVKNANNITVELPRSGINLTVEIDGEEYESIVTNNSKTAILLPDLDIGEHSIRLICVDRNCSAYDYRQVITIRENSPDLNVEVSEEIIPGEPLYGYNELPDDYDGRVTLFVDGVERDLERFNTSELSYGEHTAKFVFEDDSYYNSLNKSFSFNVVAVKGDIDDELAQNATKTFNVTYVPRIVAKPASVLYSAKGKYSVTVYGNNGKPAKNVYVVFKIRGKQVGKIKTDSKGVAKLIVSKAPGVYKISATALGKTVTRKLTVRHVVTLKKVTVKKSAKKLVLTATLKKVNGKYLKKRQVVFKFNGKKFTAKTNNKGVAKLTVKKSVLKRLKAGKKVTYQATYLKDAVKRTVKVKR